MTFLLKTPSVILFIVDFFKKGNKSKLLAEESNSEH